MTGKTHIAAGLAASIALGMNAPQIALAAFGSLLPDIDHSGSTLGKLIKPISRHIRHRGVTHSLIFLAVSMFISPYLALGVLTHIVLDLFNPKGVELFYPWKKNIKVPIISRFIKTNGIIEKLIFALLIIAILLMIVFYPDLWGYKNMFDFTTLWFPIK
ncbi:MAG: metal-dependent hydrolase [Clostridia bacterium]|nr:metal-dependent hydrolase [Clostridia bacterium]